MPLTYSSAAAQGFNRILNLYGTYNTPQVKDETTYLFDKNFWFAGNALHAMVDYLLNAELSPPNKKDLTEKVLTMGVGAYKKYSREFTNQDWWRDDYAWWGNAFLLILHNRSTLGLSQESFDQLHRSAQYCWDKLTENWHDGPYGDRDHAAGSNPNIKGGVFNIPYKESDDDMKGRNSVTNEGYWLLSQGLGKLQPEPNNYSTAAAKMHAWFVQWLDPKNHSFKEPGLRDPRKLVLERPMGNEADAGWCWTGDQGLLFRALTNVGDNETAGAIAKAALDNLSVDGVLHEYLPAGRRGFEVDYATGKGIFLRNLVSAGVKPSNCPYAVDIKHNANAVWLNRLNKETNQFSYNWAGGDQPEPLQLSAQGTKSQDLCDLVMQASGLDALNAAMLIAPSEQIPKS
jgi:hypothetical protein